MPLCTLVVDARDCGRFLLLFELTVFERDRDLTGTLSSGGGWSVLKRLANM